MILITGAFGSLGQAFVNYFLGQGEEVTGVDSSEWALAAFGEKKGLTKVLGDFTSIKGKFDLIIHCAAYKHIELIEDNKESAYENNVLKTRELYENTEGPILFISTDKAVEPSSFYGETKQVGEQMTLKCGGTVARLGNLKSSSGSVIPIWEECFKKGLPLPVTNPDMTRYMIDASEAVRKIMNLYPKGKVIVPEMGDPIRVGDLVDNLFPKAQTVTIGLRKGEKMHEKLTWDSEKLIYKNKNGGVYEQITN